jgi:exodeoxyribonuclease III
MKIATWNVNGIRARQDQVRAWLRTTAPDVACLQETKAGRDQVPPDLLHLDDYWGYWHGFKGYSGVALLVRKSFSSDRPHFQHPSFDMENRIVTAAVNGVTFVSVYVPNGGRDLGVKLRFLEELQDFSRGLRQAGLIICGDLNVAHTPKDVHPKERREVVGQLPMERLLLDEILANGLVDLGRKAAPHDDTMYTWWAPWREMKQRNIGWRLDYIYASQSLAETMTSCVVQKEIGTSDHAPVVATLK